MAEEFPLLRDSPECIGIRAGDGAILGLGVRLGTYFQTGAVLLEFVVASAIIYSNRSDVVKRSLGIQDIVNAIQRGLPIFLALVFVISLQLWQGTLSDIEFLASNYILALLMVQIYPFLTISYRARFKNFYTGAFMVVATGWFVGLNIWFWFTGYKELRNTACGTSWAFFFYKVNAYDWYKILNIVIYCILGAFTIPGLIYTFVYLFPVTKHRLFPKNCSTNGKKKDDDAPEEEDFDIGMSTIFAVAILAIIIACLIVGCELTIKWNDMLRVSSVNSTGQMLSLFVGAVALIKALWRAVVLVFTWGNARWVDTHCPYPPTNNQFVV